MPFDWIEFATLFAVTPQTLRTVVGDRLGPGRLEVRIMTGDAMQVAAGPVALAERHPKVMFQQQRRGIGAGFGRNLENRNVIPQWHPGTEVLKVFAGHIDPHIVPLMASHADVVCQPS